MARVIEINPEIDTQCIQGNWSNKSNSEEIFCPAIWDSLFCWPPALPGAKVKKRCSVIFERSYSQYASYLDGYAHRECLNNGTWANGRESNYDECKESFQSYLREIEEDISMAPTVQQFLFYSSILSLLCLGISLGIFYHFRCLRCDRVNVHIRLMLSLSVRFVFILVIAEPFVLGHIGSYRDVEYVCELVLVLYLYFTFSSVSWMFVEGLFLNVTLMIELITISSRYQFALYNIIGWGVPSIFVSVYVGFMMSQKIEENCWKGYSEMDEMWILRGPIMLELVVNGLFLLNILRILLRKVRNSSSRQDNSQLKAAFKATATLFPVLGINNLFLLYNPGGDYNKYFVMLTTFFESTQGMLVSVVLCFADKEVRAAIKRSRDRANARRFENINRIRAGTPSSVMGFVVCRENNPRENHVSDDAV